MNYVRSKDAQKQWAQTPINLFCILREHFRLILCRLIHQINSPRFNLELEPAEFGAKLAGRQSILIMFNHYF